VIVPRVGIHKTPHTWLEPDLMLLTSERVARTERYLDGADLAIEVSVGARSAVYDRTTKADTYAALGVRELWLCDLDERSIEQRVCDDTGRLETVRVFTGRDACESVVFPGLRAIPEDVFAA
jgi:Uma2 family endonuclease